MTAQLGPARPPTSPPRWLRLVALGGPLALVAGLGVLYAMGSFGSATPLACKGGAQTAARLQPLVQGEIAALNLAADGRAAPALSFKGADNRDVALADFKGRTVLLNLWATWCIPCRTEMPALDRLQAKLGGPDFAVVALNVDQGKPERPKQFLDAAGIRSLPRYEDPSAKALQDVKVFGLPTTLLIDRNGCEIGTMQGPAAWDSADAEKLIKAAAAPQG